MIEFTVLQDVIKNNYIKTLNKDKRKDDVVIFV